MRVKREMQVKAEQRAAGEEASQMEVDRGVSTMKAETQDTAVELSCKILDWFHIAFRFISDGWSEKLLKLQISYWFRFVQSDSSYFILVFRIYDWLQIGFRFISYCSLKIVKTSDLRLVQVGFRMSRCGYL